jgi:hypothetical protein
MKRIVLSLAVILFGVSVICAQKPANHGLVITGSVQGIEKKCVNGKPVIQLRLYMQFRNDGETRLLLIRPSFFFTKKVNFVADKLGDPTVRTVPADVVTYNPYLENPFGTATIEDYDPFPSYISQLDALEPSVETLMVRIDPGGYHEFQENVWLKTGFQIGGKTGSEQKECTENSKAKLVPDYPSFSLAYHLSLKKYYRYSELLMTLQNRWKRFGHLPLDSNGDFSLKSEKIVIDASK